MLAVTIYRLWNPVFTVHFDTVDSALLFVANFKQCAKFATGEYSIGVSEL